MCKYHDAIVWAGFTFAQFQNFRLDIDGVHVLSDGQIVRSGNKDLALELEEKGYGWIEAPGAA